MNDTPGNIRKMQFQIIHSKPLKERIKMMTEMTDFSRKLIENQIRRRNPGITDIELKLEVFKAFYKDDFDPPTMKKIMESYREYCVKSVVLKV
jgi:hypothetical protein